MKKITLFLIFSLLIVFDAFCQENNSNEIKHIIVRNGIGLGTVIAVVTSWDRNKSILLAIIHGIFSWLYVIYFALTEK